MNRVRRLIAAMVLVMAVRTSQGARLVLVAGGDDEREPVAATRARLQMPFGIDFNRQGTLLLIEMQGQRLRAIDRVGMLTTIAGTGDKGDAGDGGPAIRAQFNNAHSLAVAASGDIYIADTENNRVRKIDATSRSITTFAGTGRKGFGGDGGPATAAQFGGAYCVAFARGGSDRLYLADLDNRRIRAVNLATGIVETVAGNGHRGVPADGADARSAPLVDPRAVAADARGYVYILERAGNALRVVDPAGRIRTLIGPGVKDLRDDSGREPLPLKGPKHLCLDNDDNVIIADSDNHLIRKYLVAERKLVRMAGTGKSGAAGLDGDPLAAELSHPHGVHVHPSGVLYIADSYNHRLLKLEP